MNNSALGMGDLTAEQTEKVLQFQDLTGIEDVTVCKDVLQRHSWDLEVAVQDQLNIREGRPSMFATNARAPAVINDHRIHQYFFTRPRADYGGGIWGMFRYMCHLVFNMFYSTISSTLAIAFRLFRPDPRKLLTNPLSDVMSFISSFEENYGNVHPVFYQGTYAQAVNDAKQELRFLLVYLHCENNTNSVNFCRASTGKSPELDRYTGKDTPQRPHHFLAWLVSGGSLLADGGGGGAKINSLWARVNFRDVLPNPDVVSYINQHMLFWACSVNTGEGYRVSQALRENTYPLLSVIVLREGNMTVIASMEVTVDATELLRRLRMLIKDNEICLIAARAERMERCFNQTLRAQQDEAYMQSLLADQEKERQRMAEKKRLEEIEITRKRLQAEEEQRKEKIKRMKVEYLDRIPQEPSNVNPDSVQLVIKLPCGARLERRFLKSHSLEDVYNYIFCHPSSPDSFEIATNFPKRSLKCTSENGEPVKTLEEAGIKRGEVLFVYDLEA